MSGDGLADRLRIEEGHPDGGWVTLSDLRAAADVVERWDRLRADAGNLTAEYLSEVARLWERNEDVPVLAVELARIVAAALPAEGPVCPTCNSDDREARKFYAFGPLAGTDCDDAWHDASPTVCRACNDVHDTEADDAACAAQARREER